MRCIGQSCRRVPRPQRKYGNLPPKAPVWKPEKWTSAEEHAAVSKDAVDAAETEQELEDLEVDDDRFLEASGPGAGPAMAPAGWPAPTSECLEGGSPSLVRWRRRRRSTGGSGSSR